MRFQNNRSYREYIRDEISWGMKWAFTLDCSYYHTQEGAIARHWVEDFWMSQSGNLVGEDWDNSFRIRFGRESP